MKMLNKHLFSLLWVAACVALGLTTATANGQNALETIRARGKILVAIDINAPPFGYLDEQARQAGSDVDAAKLLAQDLGVALEIVPVIGQNRIPYLLSRKVDIVMASFSISEERQKVIDFSDPVGVVSVLLAGPAAAHLADWSDLAGHSVATARGTMPDLELTRGIRAHQVPSVAVVRYEDDASATTAILTGQQRFAAVSSATLSVLKKANPMLDLEAKIAVTNFLVSRIKCNTLNLQEQGEHADYGHVDDALRAPISAMYNAGALPTALIFDHMPTVLCCHL